MTDFLSLEVHKATAIVPRHLKALERLKIQTVKDLLFYLPKSYKAKMVNPDLGTLKEGDSVILEGSLLTNPQKLNSRFVIKFQVQNQIMHLVFFNKLHPFLQAKLKIGNNYIVEGNLFRHEQTLQIVHPEFIFNPAEICNLEPIYNLTYELSNKKLRQYIKKVLEYSQNIFKKFALQYPEFTTLYTCLTQIHVPQNVHSYAQESASAIEKLASFELIAHQLCMRSLSPRFKTCTYDKNADLQNKVLQNLGFSLTESQISALEEIQYDQSKKAQMIRLLQGDVGSGKTVVALLSMVNVIEKGQAALMAPTELLANQHYRYFCKALSGTNIKVCLLTGTLGLKEKNMALKSIQSEASLVIGTHALFQEKVQFRDLRYIIIDEQHRFGVRQRLSLIEKTYTPDVLLMSATPIPRSLTMAMFGDIAVSQMTTNRSQITTLVMRETKEEQIYSAIHKIISKGEKIYWICPFVEEQEEIKVSISNVENRFKKIKDQFGDVQVAMMHGGTQVQAREQIMYSFLKEQINILVATTIVEVGVDVPNATLIIIENSERFGLAQLHQLRGRVGRSHLKSYCILMYSPNQTSDTARQRLEFMKSCNDGFLIAKKDLELRGGGDTLGIKQSGSEDFYFADKISLPEERYEELRNTAQSITSESAEYHFYTKIISKRNMVPSQS